MFFQAILRCFFINWRIISLQCCVSFCHTTRWISHKYRPWFFCCFFFFLPYYEILPSRAFRYICGQIYQFLLVWFLDILRKTTHSKYSFFFFFNYKFILIPRSYFFNLLEDWRVLNALLGNVKLIF